MENNLTNKDCRLYGSPHCMLLNQKNCESCYVSKLTSEQQLLAAEDIYEIAEALPEDGVEGIMNSESCALCRQRGKEDAEANKPVVFAQMDMGHLHPTAKIGDKLGSSDRGTSMTIPVQLPVCESCRQKIGKKSYLPLALGLLVALIGLLLVSLNPVRSALTNIGRVIPLLVFLIFVFLGVIVDGIARRYLGVKNERTVNTRSKRIAAIAPLLNKGWFAIGELNDGLPFIFTKAKLDSGILTGENQRELLSEIRALDRDGIKNMVNNSAETE